MGEKKAGEIYQEILHLLKVVIERDFRPCNLEKHLETVLYDLAYEAADKNWTGWNVVVGGVFKALEQARYLAERYDKDLCHYLDMALKRGWIENWVHSFRQAMQP